jgi:prepilin-type N-terminal cleavage/methylation domain-containing protein
MNRKSQRGFTLVELMISLVMFALVTAGLLQVAVTMASGHREQQMTVGAEGSVRGAMDFVTEAMRGISPGVPTGNIQHVNTCATGALTVTNRNNAPDTITAVFASGSVLTASRNVYTTGTASLTVSDARQLAVGDTILITNLDQGHLANVTSVNLSTNVIGLANQSCGTLALPTGGYPIGSLVLRATRATFSVGTVDSIPTLMLDPDAEGPAAAEPFAEGVEDMQIALGIDTNSDGGLTETGAATNDDEWSFNRSGEVQPAGTVRALRVTFVARTTGKRSNANGYVRPAVEDRPAATVTDGYRRRALTSTIEIRNLGESP